MSAADAQTAPPDRAAFSAATVMALILVGLVSLSALAVLSAYAPLLRGASDTGAHALSSSAVGFRGAVVMLRAEDVPVLVERAEPPLFQLRRSLVVATPRPGVKLTDLAVFDRAERLLIVLPKWTALPDPFRPGFVQKLDVIPSHLAAGPALGYAPKPDLVRRMGSSRPILHGAGAMFARGTYLPLGSIDRLQTLSGDGWLPALVDDRGRIVLAASKRQPDVYVLADPDLLNTQGLADLDTARAGMAILNALKGEGPVLFDVTLDGFKRQQSLGLLLFEPPWVAATICAFAAGLLMLAHAFARFGAARAEGRAVALGQEALVDNSAGLVRMARKEPGLAPAYALLTRDLIGRGAGSGERADPAWLAELARRRGAASPETLMIEAGRAKTRADLLAIGRKLYNWRLEITRERR